MLDKFTVVTKSGIVLWSVSFESLRNETPLNDLVKEVLLEERSGLKGNTFITGRYAVEFTLDNDLGLIFVAIYQKALSLLYTSELLSTVKTAFSNKYGTIVKNKNYFGKPFNFESDFNSILDRCEDNAYAARKAQTPISRFSGSSNKGKGENQSRKDKLAENEQEVGEEKEVQMFDDDEKEEEQQGGNDEEEEDAEETRELTMAEKREALRRKRAKGRGKGKKGRGAPGKKPRQEASQPKKREKKKQTWGMDDRDVVLDRSKKGSGDDNIDEFIAQFNPSGKTNLENWDDFGLGDDSDEDEEEPEEAQSSTSWSQWFSSLANRSLNEKNLRPVLSEFKSTLVEKNVAIEIADELCESVLTKLEGQTMSSFKRVRSAVKEALEAALTRILTPKRKINVVRDVLKAKKEGRPYVIVMVGVNGVGKSTSLAKITSYLLQQDFKVLIAGCDTFRSGALEQLKVHSSCLKVPLYARGYGTDSSAVAAEAIYKAKQEEYDVVMVDTAGRMQDNSKLMVALAKLVNNNDPDLVLFVGEALVGGEGVDQLRGFNRALEEYSTATTPRLIDGIVLTKFDTIDDKVGAAISMVYITGQPIVFVGTGQTYTDLKTLNVNTIVRALLK